MGRLTAYMVAGLMLVMVSGCESMPWKREAMPPVELLEETESEVQAETKVEPVKTPAPKPWNWYWPHTDCRWMYQ